MNIYDSVNRARRQSALGFQRPDGGRNGGRPPGSTLPAPTSPRAPGAPGRPFPMPSRRQLQLRRLLDLIPPYRYGKAMQMGTKLALKIADYYQDNAQQYARPIEEPEGYEGFQLICGPRGLPIEHVGYRASTNPPASTYCNINFQTRPTTTWQPGTHTLIIESTCANGACTRVNYSRVWYRPLVAPNNPPVWNPAVNVPRPMWPLSPQPMAPPWLIPELTPPLAPQPKPSMPPFRLIPFLPGLPHREAGNGTGPAPGTRLPPYAQPAADPGGATKPPFTSPTHNSVPPGRGTKEKKKKGNWPKYLEGGVSAAGEFVDYVDAAHDSLPRRYQKGNTPQEKLRDIYDHLDKMSWPKFMFNLALNQAEDRAWGKIGGALGKASANKGGLTGLQTGPWDTAGGYYAGQI